MLTRQGSSEQASSSSRALVQAKVPIVVEALHETSDLFPKRHVVFNKQERQRQEARTRHDKLARKAADSAKFPLQLQHAQALQKLMCRASDSTASVNPPALLQGVTSEMEPEL
jgi:hypothetical protein